jgi:hypothetical protein
MTSHKTRGDKCSWFPNMWSVTVSILCEFQQGNGAQISLKMLYEKLRTSGTAWSSTFKTLHTIAHNIADKETWNVYCHRHVESCWIPDSNSLTEPQFAREILCAREGLKTWWKRNVRSGFYSIHLFYVRVVKSTFDKWS